MDDGERALISDGVDPIGIAELRWLWAQEADPDVGPWRADRDFLGSVARWMADPSRTVWHASVQERAVGMVCLTEYQRMPSPRTRASGSWGYLGHLYVCADQRLSGIGTQLVAEVVRAAERRGYSKIVLSPSVESIRLYERHGFTQGNGLMVRRTAGAT
ncbi:GNAT family N-acetyltransferase [Gordonia sp. CPCC 206044]|uniref:GNAT family N-acetyltransferase n=1 Tax=Gordonia sp. CPCC 206044 TaxID=3140793 RepID=UPI003AF40986